MKPILLAENFFSRTQFPAHVIAASAAASYTEAWRVGTGRRSPRDQWSPGVSIDSWIRVDCVVARSADLIALDRGHNLLGKTVQLQGSADAAAWTTLVTAVIPAVTSSGGSVDGANGVTTEEGAWLKRFDSAAFRYWRLFIPAGAVVPSVVGLWLGTSWTPELYLDLPWSDSERQLAANEAESDVGWVGRTAIRAPQIGELGIKLANSAEYESAARYHIEWLFLRWRPTWILQDPAHAERAVLAVPRPGRQGFTRQEGWTARQMRLQWVEHEALP